MAHRSGGGSHGGGHHGGGGHRGGGRGGSNGPHYSSRPFRNSRRFRYYDRRGRERYLYGSEMPKKMGVISLIVSILPLIPFILVGIFTLVYPLSSIMPPKPLTPVYEPTDVHIMDTIGVIDNKDSLEKVLQEFEDTTGISPYIMTVYHNKWRYYNELWDYAYSEYLNTFNDEQHFLIVYSEPENAEELDFVDWFWEGIQGDETDPILTESKVYRFGEDLHDNFLRNNISVGEAFELAFEESLTYIMGKDDNDEASSWIFFGIVWNAFVLIFVVSTINSFIISRRDYQEVPMEGSSNTVPGAMGYGNNTANQNGQIYQSNTNNKKKFMYYDKNGNKKYISSSMEPAKDAFGTMLVVLIIVIALLYNFFPPLWNTILMIQKGTSLGGEIPPLIAFYFVTYLVINLALFIAAFFAVRRYLVHKNRDYVDVTGSSALYDEGMSNNNATQYNGGMSNNSAAQYNEGMPNNSAAQYNEEMSNNNAAQYNTASVADSDFYNDESRFRSPEYYDDDARYHGSTAYEAGKK